MRSLRLVAALSVVLAFPFAAQARFGKANSPSHDSSSSSDSDSHSSSSSDSSHENRVHHAQAANEGSYVPPSNGGGGYTDYGYRRGYGGWHHGWYAWGFGYSPFWYAAAPEPTYTGAQGQPSVVSTLEFHAQAMMPSTSASSGAAVGFMYAVEGPQLGLLIDDNSMFLAADDGTLDTDGIHLLNAHLTYAVVSTPYGRLRLEGGLDAAVAPDISFFGPGGGVSGVIGLFGSTSLEASVRVTPYPFTKVDWNAGLSFGLGSVALRAGFRETYLDDQGRVDGVSHQDLLYGPYVGLALAM